MCILSSSFISFFHAGVNKDAKPSLPCQPLVLAGIDSLLSFPLIIQNEKDKNHLKDLQCEPGARRKKMALSVRPPS